MLVGASTHADDPERVRPEAGAVNELPEPTAPAGVTFSDRLDEGHDWLYRKMQRFFAATDLYFGAPSQAPMAVPLSPVRIGVDLQLLHQQDGFDLRDATDLEIALSLPNLEKRLKLFLSSATVQEVPVDPAAQHNPLNLGARLALLPGFNAELGVQASRSPAAFAALRWARSVSAGPLTAYFFEKPYVQSGVGIADSAGVTLEAWEGRWMVRSTSYGDWVRNSAATGWVQSLVFGYAPAVLQERRYDLVATGQDLACGIIARVAVSGDHLSRSTDYEASLLLKKPIHGSWLFAYLEPVALWKRTNDWHPDLGVRAGLDVLFWGVASRAHTGSVSCGALGHG